MSVTRTYVMWGWTGRYGVRIAMAIMCGTLHDCRVRQRQFRSDYSDALTGIYPVGIEPKGLALQVQERVEARP